MDSAGQVPFFCHFEERRKLEVPRSVGESARSDEKSLRRRYTYFTHLLKAIRSFQEK